MKEKHSDAPVFLFSTLLRSQILRRGDAVFFPESLYKMTFIAETECVAGFVDRHAEGEHMLRLFELLV